jgi:3-phosphoshikimate 1-carboxyvinyltransferase
VPIGHTTDPTTGAKIYTVKGNGGPFTQTGSEVKEAQQQVPMELFLGNAGTAMRPLAAALCFGDGNYVLVRSYNYKKPAISIQIIYIH